jgi:hypothetical protein
MFAVNVINLSRDLEDKRDIYNQTDEQLYQYIHSKVSHEFGHIRENYGLV